MAFAAIKIEKDNLRFSRLIDKQDIIQLLFKSNGSIWDQKGQFIANTK